MLENDESGSAKKREISNTNKEAGRVQEGKSRQQQEKQGRATSVHDKRESVKRAAYLTADESMHDLQHFVWRQKYRDSRPGPSGLKIILGKIRNCKQYIVESYLFLHSKICRQTI